MQQAGCKCHIRAAALLARDQLRRQQANLPHPKHPRTFENFQERAGTEEAVRVCQQFVLEGTPTAMVLAGTTGNGKSHLLEAIGRAMLEQGVSVRYEFVPTLIDRLRHTHDDDSEQDVAELMAWYGGVFLLLLDDLGAERMTPFGIEKVTELVDQRLRDETRLVVATNKRYEELLPLIGPRLASRIYQGNPELGDMLVVPIGASDYRR